MHQDFKQAQLRWDMVISCRALALSNPTTITDFDDELPYQRRHLHGETIITRDVPPPNWAEQSIYMVASSLQAVARDGSGHLQVYFRTWLLHHSVTHQLSPVTGRSEHS